jgi:phosphotriesterase-related protein
VLAHSGDSTDPDHLAELADAGFVLGMDRFGLDAVSTFEDRVGIVAELCRRGHAGRMVLAHDAACHIDWIHPEWRAGLPRWNFLHIMEEVLPALAERGVPAEQVNEMLVDVPARFFGTRCAHPGPAAEA